MDPVIQAARVALGRTLLAAPSSRSAAAPSPAPAPMRVVSDVPVPPLPAVDETALRRAVEASLRTEHEQRVQAAIAKEREAARHAGFEQGMAEGRGAAQDEARKASEALQADARRAEEARRGRIDQVLGALGEAHGTAVSAWRTDVADAAFEALVRVVGDRGVTREFVLAMVTRVCAGLGADTTAVARMHPRDIALLDAGDGPLALGAGLVLTLVADETLAEGGVVVDASAGRFDGSLATQLARLREAFDGAGGGTP
jgi:flagellar biosynthesis/type III secretory pathway protein FliH